jgi:hypothetical protein
MGDKVAALCVATYLNRPSRKAVSWARILQQRLFQRRAPAAITLRFSMKQESLTKALRWAIVQVSNCVRDLENRFAVDSTYLKTPNLALMIKRHGPETMVVEKSRSAKMHLAIGTRSKMVVGVAISDGDDHDAPYFMNVFNQFNRRFRIDEVLADAAYDSEQIYEAVDACGGKAYIDRPSNAMSKPGHYGEMFRLRDDDFDSWFEHYRFRTLVECSNSSLKRTIKRIVRARLPKCRENEMLLICLVFNLLRLIAARAKYGISIPWADPSTLQLIDDLARPENGSSPQHAS